ncbi:MAG: hypothetical protein V1749_02510, partial [Candidatus Desantisbacteria bacterium]
QITQIKIFGTVHNRPFSYESYLILLFASFQTKVNHPRFFYLLSFFVLEHLRNLRINSSLFLCGKFPSLSSYEWTRKEPQRA